MVCLMHFRGCGNALALYFIGANDCSTCVPKAREKEWRNRVHTNVGALCAVERANAVNPPVLLKAKANVAPAIVSLVYLRRAQDDGETPKTGLVAVLGTAETVFGVSGCFRSPLLWFIT